MLSQFHLPVFFSTKFLTIYAIILGCRQISCNDSGGREEGKEAGRKGDREEEAGAGEVISLSLPSHLFKPLDRFKTQLGLGKTVRYF